MKKRGQINLSFGMIFSIILIIAFMAVAFYAINMFLDLKDKTAKAQFVEDFEEKVLELHRSSILGASYIFEESIPGNVEKVCFWDSSKSTTGSDKGIVSELKRVSNVHNFYFYPRNSALPSVEIKYIDMDSFTSNPYCINVAEEKIKIFLEKKEGSSLISVSKVV
ncbi:MAG: hypothetical protein WC533_00365 [Candidatus Pacearchaeota archaeon]